MGLRDPSETLLHFLFYQQEIGAASGTVPGPVQRLDQGQPHVVALGEGV